MLQSNCKRSGPPKGKRYLCFCKEGFHLVPLHSQQDRRLSRWKPGRPATQRSTGHFRLPERHCYKRKIPIRRSYEILKVNLLAEARRGSGTSC